MEHIKDWSRRAKCRGTYALTKKFCEDCPVRGECYTFAIVHQDEGVWGGSTDDERSPKVLGVGFINGLRALYRSFDLLQDRPGLSKDEELAEAQPKDEQPPIFLMGA